MSTIPATSQANKKPKSMFSKESSSAASSQGYGQNDATGGTGAGYKSTRKLAANSNTRKIAKSSYLTAAVQPKP